MSHRFTMSGLFAGFLETVTVADGSTPNSRGFHVLVCTQCNDEICTVEPDDTLEVLLVTALKHDDECTVRLANLGAST